MPHNHLENTISKTLLDPVLTLTETSSQTRKTSPKTFTPTENETVSNANFNSLIKLPKYGEK